ncbi:MAG: zinc ribbon domain-containing protein [Phycisphaerales bacterium]|nr:zinc ribbon domain-containing protein [Phycisphaerales bacterium]
MGLLQVRQPDDRGSVVPIINMYRRRRTTDLEQVFSRAEYDRIRQFLHQRSSSWPQLATFGIVILTGLGVGVVSSIMDDYSVRTRVVLEGLRAVVVLGGIMAAFRVHAAIDAGRVRRELVYRKRCASCGYSLAELTMEDDGCTVCPECGAAWRLKESGV